MAFRFAVPDTLAVIPLITGLEADSECEVVRDTPANIGVRFSGAGEQFDAALISPFDYARHGGSYRILPGIAVSVVEPTGVSRLRIRPDAVTLTSLATDLRSTSDVVLATLLLKEKYPPAGREGKGPVIVPVENATNATFGKADAVLEWFPSPPRNQPEGFFLDLYDEWLDLTEAPLVLGFWVVREEADSKDVFSKVTSAAKQGVADLSPSITRGAERYGLDEVTVRSVFGKHSYTMGVEQMDGIDSLFRVAFAHSVLGDVPEIVFFDPSETVNR